MELPTDEYMAQLQKAINLRNHIRRKDIAIKRQTDREHSDLDREIKELTKLG